MKVVVTNRFTGSMNSLSWSAIVLFTIIGLAGAQLSIETQIDNTELFNRYCNEVGNAWITQVVNGFEITMTFYVIMNCDGIGASVTPAITLFPGAASGQIAVYPLQGSVADKTCTLQLIGPDPYSSDITASTTPSYIYYKVDVSCMPKPINSNSQCVLTSFWDWINPLSQFQCGTFWHNGPIWIYADTLVFVFVGVVIISVYGGMQAEDKKRRLSYLGRIAYAEKIEMAPRAMETNDRSGLRQRATVESNPYGFSDSVSSSTIYGSPSVAMSPPPPTSPPVSNRPLPPIPVPVSQRQYPQTWSINPLAQNATPEPNASFSQLTGAR